jgi:hypothetical protein
MKKSELKRDRYFLRDLHREIAFYDRKLAYLNSHIEFASQADRDEAEKSLLAKRNPLEKTARALAASGVEFDEKDLPQSFRIEGTEQEAAHKGLTLV